MKDPPNDGHTYKLVFCRYIVRNGRKIYPVKAKVFRFWVRVDK